MTDAKPIKVQHTKESFRDKISDLEQTPPQHALGLSNQSGYAVRD